MKINGKEYRTIWFENNIVKIIDQTKLPHQFIINELKLELPSCIINIGGVSNLTYWDGNELIGFDTGPGNALMDDYMLNIFNKNFDKNGNFASKGNPIKSEIEKFLKHDFFKIIPPKSLDRNKFSPQYNELIKKQFSVHDTMATLAEFTVETIVTSFQLLPKKVKNIIITGGGYRNIHLMNRLKDRLQMNILNEKKYYQQAANEKLFNTKDVGEKFNSILKKLF